MDIVTTSSTTERRENCSLKINTVKISDIIKQKGLRIRDWIINGKLEERRYNGYNRKHYR